MLAGMASVVADAAEGERSLGRTLVSDAALLALWPSTGSVTPTGEAEVRELAEEGGATDQDFCQRLQCPIGSVLHLTDSEASWGENRSPWSQCGDNDEDDPPPHRLHPTPAQPTADQKRRHSALEAIFPTRAGGPGYPKAT